MSEEQKRIYRLATCSKCGDEVGIIRGKGLRGFAEDLHVEIFCMRCAATAYLVGSFVEKNKSK